jgi:hypothetical protein
MPATKPRPRRKSAKQPAATRQIRLLAGGNPQIPKGHGDAPVEAYIAAIPDWKQEIARWVDAAVVRAVPGVRKAVKYNSPLYGAAGRQDWFLSLHCHVRYVKVAFFRGADLDPPPPGESKQKAVRYLDIGEGDAPDAKQFAAWRSRPASCPAKSCEARVVGTLAHR